MNTMLYGIAGFVIVIAAAFIITNYKMLLGKGKKKPELKNRLPLWKMPK